MNNKIIKASTGKIFAFKNDKNTITYLGSTLYLGVNDDGSRYFETDPPIETEPIQEEPIEENNNQGG